MMLSKLARVRKAKGIEKPEELALRAGVSTMTIRRAENGKGIILNNAKAIAKALHVKLEELI